MGVVLGEPVPVAAGGSDATTIEASVSDAGGLYDDDSAVALELSGDAATSEQGSPTGGVPFLDVCPGDEVVVGLEGNLTYDVPSLVLGAIQATCASIAVDPSSGQVTTGPGAELAIQGTGPPNTWTQRCPPDQVVVGFMGRSGAAVDQAAFECASLAVELDAGAFAMGSLVVLTAAGGDGGVPFQSQCPVGQLARGLVGRSGAWVDELGLACATPVLGGGDQ